MKTKSAWLFLELNCTVSFQFMLGVSKLGKVRLVQLDLIVAR